MIAQYIWQRIDQFTNLSRANSGVPLNIRKIILFNRLLRILRPRRAAIVIMSRFLCIYLCCHLNLASEFVQSGNDTSSRRSCRWMSLTKEKYLLNQKYHKAEYVQRHVCFVNVQVPCPHSKINVKFCPSRLCMKMSSFLFMLTWAMPRISYLSCGVPFPVWTPDNISGLISVVLWLLRWEVIKKKIQVIFS